MSSLNFQNFPKRDNKEIRNIIRAPEGHLIVSCDYSQLEARCLAMASKDKVFCQAIWDDSDTHQKWAERLVYYSPQLKDKFPSKDPNKPLKGLRDDVKNMLVFKTFYGASKSSVAKHYIELGMSQEDIDLVFEEFWDTYKGVKEWQKTLLTYFDKYGYVKSLTGRKRRQPLSPNKVINFPIQSTASLDICLGAGNRLSNEAYIQNKPQYQYRINVHDDLTFYVPEKTLIDDITYIGYVMTQPIFSFINVPLEIEFSIGRNWGSMVDTGKIKTTEFYDYEDNCGESIWIPKPANKFVHTMLKASRESIINRIKHTL